MIVNAASRMFRAISLGVFCRLAPSTSAIIRSRKLSPGFWVTLITIRSDSTRVPPVTPDRSPPDSRMTGADSPVMADSSTLAIPSTTSPSPGMTSPASTTTMSPGRNVTASTISSRYSAESAPALQPVSRRARASCLARRSVAACAFPRPSATASARFAKITVSHSHAVINHANTDGWRIDNTVVAAEPISTMNITGLRHIVDGFNLRNASGTAFTSWEGCRAPAPTRLGCVAGAGGAV